MSAFDTLMAFQRDTEALSQVAGRLAWDLETMAPKGAAPQRADEMAAMEGVLHGRRSDPRVGEWLEAAEPDDDVGQAQLREIRRAYARATKVPAPLVADIARITSLAHGIWADARATEDWSAFAPTLAEIIHLRREEAAALAGDGDLYDALLEDYEPGTSSAEIDALFAELRPGLVALRERILGAETTPPALPDFRFDEPKQLALTQELARTFGYDFDHGRIDLAVHPFSSGSGLDVRITTRTDPGDPFNAIYSTIHEVGHAAYEQGVNRAYLLTPIGQGASMGVHESQSRIYENQIGRSEAFTRYLFGRMGDVFGDFGVPDAHAFYRLVNRVHPGFIRTEADEVHYNLHVMLRFDLERDLIAGRLEVADLPEAWNARFAADFGGEVDRPSNGVLQDVHWSAGLFGYFPTYTLGNVYAGALHQAMRAAIPALDDDLAAGRLENATTWLRDNLQTHGKLFPPRDIIAMASGAPATAGPFLRYLEDKFTELYNL